MSTNGRTAAKNANEAIAFAAQAVASADRNLKLAAEYLAYAEAEGKTQRQMAEGVGKSAAWVNRLLQWRRDGYPEDTPFGTQSQERDERHDERLREDARSGPKHESEQERSGSSRSGSSHARQRSRYRSGPKHKPKRDRQGFSEHDRTTLVRVLGMLGSSNDHEVLVAARKAEEIRSRLGLTWDDLIAAAAEWQRRAAA
jgi:transposase